MCDRKWIVSFTAGPILSLQWRANKKKLYKICIRNSSQEGMRLVTSVANLLHWIVCVGIIDIMNGFPYYVVMLCIFEFSLQDCWVPHARLHHSASPRQTLGTPWTIVFIQDETQVCRRAPPKELDNRLAGELLLLLRSPPQPIHLPTRLFNASIFHFKCIKETAEKESLLCCMHLGKLTGLQCNNFFPCAFCSISIILNLLVESELIVREKNISK